MQQYLLMIKFALQPAHNGIANLTTIAQVDDGLARGSEHRQARAQMRWCRGGRTIPSVQLARVDV